MNYETQESADSQIHFRRAKQCYLNTHSNTLLNLEAAFVACRPWVIPSPGKYSIESSVEITCYQQDHDAPRFCTIFTVSEFGVFNRSILAQSSAPQIQSPMRGGPSPLLWFDTRMDIARLNWVDFSFPWEDTAFGQPSHGTRSPWTQEAAVHLAPQSCSVIQLVQPGTLLTVITVFYQLLQLGPQRCSGVLGTFTPP